MSDLSTLPQTPQFPAGVTDQHGKDAFEVRFGTATKEATKTNSVSHTTNGDEALYADKSGTYTKCLLQDAPGVVNLNAFQKFRVSLDTGKSATPGKDVFEDPGLLGGHRKLNGPQGAFTLTLAGGDSRSFGDPDVPIPPAVASKEYATELVELYWASLLRDVAFTEYETNATAIAAAKELTSLKSSYAGPKDASGNVTPHLLFRGGFDEEDVGPYISQFCITPTNLGAQKIDQRMQTYAAGVDYMTCPADWAAVQNGVIPSQNNQIDPMPRYMYNGRVLGSFTHQDELYQAYFTAYLVLESLGIGWNNTSPYTKYNNQQPFGNFGGPDIAGTLAAVARAALNAGWYQKWIVHLRHRPESGGGIVELIKTGQGAKILKKTGGGNDTLHSAILDSVALQLSHLRNDSFLLSQAFPEGSPAHPAYPTGHGTVAGACITVLKFFFDGTANLSFPLVPSRDGLSLETYNGPDAGRITVNGELNKLAHNISFGHGIHAGIHWRSDTDASILLGEAVALKYLRDQAYTYKENFAVDLYKVDGSLVQIKNY